MSAKATTLLKQVREYLDPHQRQFSRLPGKIRQAVRIFLELCLAGHGTLEPDYISTCIESAAKSLDEARKTMDEKGAIDAVAKGLRQAAAVVFYD